MFKKSLLAIVAVTALFGFNANSFAQTYYDNFILIINTSIGIDTDTDVITYGDHRVW